MIFFSIVIPVYNAERYLNECVQSVVAQTYGNFEIILVDDGSVDASGIQCEQWVEKDPRIRAIHQENSGAAVARNVGIAQAIGEYILFLDSDDWWDNTELLACLAERLSRCPSDVVSFNFCKQTQGVTGEPYFSADTAPTKMTGQESLSYVMVHDLWISSSCNKAIRRKLLIDHDVLYREGIFSEDIDWCLRLALNAHRFDYVNMVGFVYRQHALSSSHSGSTENVVALMNNVRYCVHLLQEHMDAQKANQLRSYVAYQYGTLLYCIAGLLEKREKNLLIGEVNELKYLLAYSKNSKIQLMYNVSRVVGLRGLICMLGIMQHMKNRR